MNRNEIIELADSVWGYAYWGPAQLDRLEHFASLVAAAEREACADEADHQAAAEPYGHVKFRCANIAAAIRARGLK